MNYRSVEKIATQILLTMNICSSVLNPRFTKKSKANDRLAQRILVYVCRVSNAICDYLTLSQANNWNGRYEWESFLNLLHCKIIALISAFTCWKEKHRKRFHKFPQDNFLNPICHLKLSDIHSNVWIAYDNKGKNHNISHKSKQFKLSSLY